MKEIIQIAATLLDPHPLNQIYFNHPTRLEGLIVNIKDNGILNPLLVIPNDERYIIVSGHSRFEAGKTIGITEFPAIVMDIDPDDIEYTIVSSNQSRIKLDSEIAKEMPILKAHYEKRRGERTDLTGEGAQNTRKKLADYFNMSEGQVAKYELISDTQPELFNRIDDEQISINQASEYCKKLKKGEAPPTYVERAIEPQVCCSECQRPLTKAMIKNRNKKNQANGE